MGIRAGRWTFFGTDAVGPDFDVSLSPTAGPDPVDDDVCGRLCQSADGRGPSFTFGAYFNASSAYMSSAVGRPVVEDVDFRGGPPSSRSLANESVRVNPISSTVSRTLKSSTSCSTLIGSGADISTSIGARFPSLDTPGSCVVTITCRPCWFSTTLDVVVGSGLGSTS